jgi:hypothetical protein
VAAVRACDGRPNSVSCRAKRAVGATARGLDSHLAPSDLGRERRETVREFKTVGDQYNPDQLLTLPQN